MVGDSVIVATVNDLAVLSWPGYTDCMAADDRLAASLNVHPVICRGQLRD